ncbi:MAG: xanthosine triphosphate pyrophosphatase [Gammaproteobacteria bacterium]|jgi:XTP/dITP diphosphohydrolase|nr:xanthosine triphosphate pyrophosphatase [Gammaproteobacteria bacterium]
MMKNIPHPAIVLASNNQGKLQEFQEIFSGIHVNLIPQSNFGAPEIEETGLTFVENAILKARNAAAHTGLPALGDDSGLEVDILNGAPGIFSARYAGHHGDFGANCKKLLSDLIATGPEERSARFQCVLALLKHECDPSPLICHGTWEGSILLDPAGENGFGYDPLFYVHTHKCSAAELSATIKNQISHRAQAIQLLLRNLAAKLNSC